MVVYNFKLEMKIGNKKWQTIYTVNLIQDFSMESRVEDPESDTLTLPHLQQFVNNYKERRNS